MLETRVLKSVVDNLILQYVRKHHSTSYAELLSVIERSQGEVSVADINRMIEGMMSEVLLPEIGSARPSNREY